MSQDIGDLGGLQPVVDRHRDQPCLKAGKIEINHLYGIAPVNGHAVAGLQALSKEPARQSIRGLVQRLVGNYLFTADERGFLRFSAMTQLHPDSWLFCFVLSPVIRKSR